MKGELLKLIENIQQKTGMGIGEISEKAGYATNYLSVVLSKNQISRKLYNNISKILHDPNTKPDAVGNKPSNDLSSMIKTTENTSETALITARTNEMLAMMLKEKEAANSSDNLKAEEIVAARLQGLQRAIVELGKGKLWQTEKEGQDYIYNLTYGNEQKESVKDT